MGAAKATRVLQVLILAILIVALAVLAYFYNQSQIQVTKSQSQISDLTAQISRLNTQVANLQTQTLQNDLNVSLTKADQFDSHLHDLLQEHTFLLIYTTRRSLDSSASYNASLVALQNNVNEVGALLTTIYGANVAQQFVSLWNNKTNIFLTYANNVKNNVSKANIIFNTAALDYEASVAQFWANNNNPYPVFDYDTMLQLVTANVNDVKSAVDAWNSKNYNAYFVEEDAAYTQVGIYADMIAQGIINQNPNLFK